MAQSQTEKDGEGMKMNKPLRIIHIMADGTTRDSVAGVVIKSDQFYQVLHGIVEKRQNPKAGGDYE